MYKNRATEHTKLLTKKDNDCLVIARAAGLSDPSGDGIAPRDQFEADEFDADDLGGRHADEVDADYMEVSAVGKVGAEPRCGHELPEGR